MITSFANKLTERIWNDEHTRLPPDIENRARRKLAMIEAATQLSDLRTPPGNRLERLGGDREGQHSIRINSQWRICFEWVDDNAHNVEIVDYH